MKKWVCLLLCILLAVAIVTGIINQQSRGNIQAEPSQSAPTRVKEAPTAPGEQTFFQTEPNGEGAHTQVIKEYPALRLSINANCSSATETRQLPVITARVSERHYEELLQDLFLSRFPDAVLEKDEYEYARSEDDPVMVTHKGWVAKDASSNILGYMYIEGDGTMYFEDLYMETNGKISDNSSKYKLSTDETGAYTGSFTQQESVDQAVLTMKAYTDFDLFPSDVRKMRYGSGYNVVLQLMYQETPISFHLDLVSEESGISYFGGISLFGQIREGENSSVMCLEDALSVLEQKASGLVDENNTWDVYRIQLEYYGEYDGENNPGLYTFRPAWTFYYTVDDVFDGVVQFYADTGAICGG